MKIRHMNRTQFLAIVIGVAIAVGITMAVGDNHSNKEDKMNSATLHKDREGDSHWVLGDRYTFKATGAQTNGRFMLLEALVFPGNGPPPHRHSREDETFFVLDGELEFMVSGQIHKLGKGASVYLPEGVLHTFRNTSESPAKVLILTTPAGIEAFFVQIGTPVSDLDETPPAVTQEDVAKVMELAPKYGITIEVPE